MTDADTRPLVERVQTLANRFGAMAIGAEKSLALPVAKNHRRDALTLHSAAERIKELEARVEELEWALLGMTAAAQNHLPDSAKQHNLQMALKVLKEPDQ